MVEQAASEVAWAFAEHPSDRTVIRTRISKQGEPFTFSVPLQRVCIARALPHDFWSVTGSCIGGCIGFCSLAFAALETVPHCGSFLVTVFFVQFVFSFHSASCGPISGPPGGASYRDAFCVCVAGESRVAVVQFH